MPWTLAIKKLENGKMKIIERGQEPDADDPLYGDEVHITPCKVNADRLDFGVHDFTRDCYCHPEIRSQVFGRTMIIHKEAVN